MKNSEHPFFRPLWRRVVIVAVCTVWTGLEFDGGESIWRWIAFAFTAYAAVNFLIFYKPPGDAPATPPEGGKSRE